MCVLHAWDESECFAGIYSLSPVIVLPFVPMGKLSHSVQVTQFIEGRLGILAKATELVSGGAGM